MTIRPDGLVHSRARHSHANALVARGRGPPGVAVGCQSARGPPGDASTTPTLGDAGPSNAPGCPNAAHHTPRAHTGVDDDRESVGLADPGSPPPRPDPPGASRMIRLSLSAARRSSSPDAIQADPRQSCVAHGPPHAVPRSSMRGGVSRPIALRCRSAVQVSLPIGHVLRWSGSRSAVPCLRPRTHRRDGSPFAHPARPVSSSPPQRTRESPPEPR